MTTSVMKPITTLHPVRRWWLRALVFAILMVFPIVSNVEWYKKLFFALSMAVCVGSYPVARIRGEHFERLTFVMFVPARTRRWSTDRFTQIETESDPEDEMAGTWWWYFGDWYLLWTFMDWIVPWIGGPTKLWLRAKSGKRVLAWQGQSDRQFRENLELLQHRLGLPVG